MATKETLEGLMAEVLGIPVESIGEETSMHAVGRWDSLKHVELMTRIEDSFEITFDVDEIPELVRFTRIREALAKKGVEL